MYNAQITREKIKEICKSQKINIGDMLDTCGLGINAINQINNTKGMASFSLAKIADYLNCSVDYLLGRIDNPNGTYSINGDNNVQINDNKGDYFTINNSEQSQQDKLTKEFIKIFDTLEFTEKVEIMKIVTDMIKK